MQRYNQGFGFFGPMEKCDSGKWCKSEDADTEIASLGRQSMYLIDLWDRSIRREIGYRDRISGAAAIAVLGWGIIAASLLKYAFTGHIL